jgi:hypothetical protein
MFDLEFVIFDKNKPISHIQRKIRNDLFNIDLHKILENIYRDDKDFKYLYKCEPAISTKDEKKQLRCSLNKFLNSSLEFSHSIYFDQNESEKNNYFTLEELKNITKKIKPALEEYLGYKINSFIYIKID